MKTIILCIQSLPFIETTYDVKGKIWELCVQNEVSKIRRLFEFSDYSNVRKIGSEHGTNIYYQCSNFSIISVINEIL